MKDSRIGNALSAAYSESLVRNALAYTSPEWHGLTARVLYSAGGEGRSINGNRESVYEIGLRYVRTGSMGSMPILVRITVSGMALRIRSLRGWLMILGTAACITSRRAMKPMANWLAALTYMNRHFMRDAYITPTQGPQDSLSIKSRAIGVNLAYTLGRWMPHFQYQHAWQPSDFFQGAYSKISSGKAGTSTSLAWTMRSPGGPNCRLLPGTSRAAMMPESTSRT